MTAFAILLDVTRHSGTPMPSGLDHLIAEKLQANGLITIHRAEHLDDEDDGLVAITWDGIEAAEELLDRIPPNASEVVPASDRYVLIGDNERAAFSEDISALEGAIRGSNEGSEEDRRIALYEIAIIQAAVVAPIASTELIERFVNWVQKVMLKVFAGAVVAEVAHRLVQALLALL